jgi:RNA-directed DNA polymerase
MPEDAPPNGDAPPDRVVGPLGRVSEMQAKLHRWAAADPGRRFDDLFNFVHDPATLLVAFARVAGNRGANTPGVDGWTVAAVEEHVGAPGFLDGLRTSLKEGRSGRCRCVNAASPSRVGRGRFVSWAFPRSPTGWSRRR